MDALYLNSKLILKLMLSMLLSINLSLLWVALLYSWIKHEELVLQIEILPANPESLITWTCDARDWNLCWKSIYTRLLPHWCWIWLHFGVHEFQFVLWRDLQMPTIYLINSLCEFKRSSRKYNVAVWKKVTLSSWLCVGYQVFLMLCLILFGQLSF